MTTETKPQSNGTTSPVTVAISYSHADEAILRELEKHLSALKRQGVILTWYDRQIIPGTEWKAEIDRKIEEANVILLLISADFISSDYCHEIEMKRALERHDAGTAIVIPVLIRPCDWKGEPFGKLQALPKDAKSVDGPGWHSRDEALTNVSEGIRAAIDAWKRKQKSVPSKQIPHVSSTSTVTHQSAFLQPRRRNTKFNGYQATRDILVFLETEISKRLDTFDAAGFVSDIHRKEGRVCIRIEADGRSLYYLDFWQGGMLGNEKGLAFCSGWGNPNTSGITATADIVPDNNTGEPRIEYMNFSGFHSAGEREPYSKEEFLDELWNEIVGTVNRLNR